MLDGPWAQHSDILLAAICEAVYRRSHPLVSRDLKIVRSQMSGTATLSGLALSILDEMGGIRVDGALVALNSPTDAIALGIALIPEDRLRQGVIIEHSVADNLALSVFERISAGGWISARKQSGLAEEKIGGLKIKTASPSAPVRTLSGGNQQKVVLGKWLATDPRIIILDEPTAGIDIGSKSEIIQLIRTLAEQGKGIIVISSELNELLAACDRILVMSDGRLAKEIPREALSPLATTASDESMQQAEHMLQEAIQEVRIHV